MGGAIAFHFLQTAAAVTALSSPLLDVRRYAKSWKPRKSWECFGASEAVDQRRRVVRIDGRQTNRKTGMCWLLQSRMGPQAVFQRLLRGIHSEGGWGCGRVFLMPGTDGMSGIARRGRVRIEEQDWKLDSAGRWGGIYSGYFASITLCSPPRAANSPVTLAHTGLLARTTSRRMRLTAFS